MPFEKKCQRCGKTFTVRLRDQVYCSRACSNASHKGVNLQTMKKPQPDIVKIRLFEGLPVFPEFYLTPGKIYEAEKHRSTRQSLPVYLVRLDEAHTTLVRPTECEEVST